ncbi:hypothetical protein CEXT_750711 [Caerostris extrusa]|uniref:Uncharacterized protein n=1 Tax=Caerostris extrusa TaxID=172846 RepID=A0AAV4THQ3_CAEEX|nr:hypothetical protein CEXT_750711 [Caerostris extrusa]
MRPFVHLRRRPLREPHIGSFCRRERMVISRLQRFLPRLSGIIWIALSGKPPPQHPSPQCLSAERTSEAFSRLPLLALGESKSRST